MSNIILAVKNNKAIVYRGGERYCKFACVILEQHKQYNVGDTIDSWFSGKYYNSITSCVLNFHHINYNIDTVVAVMDDVDLDEFDIFECEVCGETLDIDERCKEHYSKWDNVCKHCCEECKDEQAYWDSVDSKIDMERGK